jgi:hypothetical protein
MECLAETWHCAGSEAEVVRCEGPWTTLSERGPGYVAIVVQDRHNRFACYSSLVSNVVFTNPEPDTKWSEAKETLPVIQLSARCLIRKTIPQSMEAALRLHGGDQFLSSRIGRSKAFGICVWREIPRWCCDSGKSWEMDRNGYRTHVMHFGIYRGTAKRVSTTWVL